MVQSSKTWKYLSIGLAAVLGSLALLAVIPSSEAAVPELRGSLLEKILFTIQTTNGVAHLNFVDNNMQDGEFSLQSILDEGKGYFGDYRIHVISGGQHVTLTCVGTDTVLIDAAPGTDTVFDGRYACGGVYLGLEDMQDGNDGAASTIVGTISFTKGGFLEYS